MCIYLAMIRRNVISLVSDLLVPFFIKILLVKTDKYSFTYFLLVAQLVIL
jgi:hypothetical protein